MWNTLDTKTRLELMDNYKKGYPDFSYRDMVNHFNDISKYGDGGKLKPIYTNNLNDPKLKSYSDSLNLYSGAKEDYKQFENNFGSNHSYRLRAGDYRTDVDNKIDPNNKPLYWKDYNTSMGTYQDAIYKEPIQPIIYKPRSNSNLQTFNSIQPTINNNYPNELAISTPSPFRVTTSGAGTKYYWRGNSPISEQEYLNQR